jgi:uroporphyrinogen decarboxylase
MNQLFRVRGMAEGLMDLVANQDFACAFLDRLTETIIAAQEHFLDEVGDLIDVHFAADDLAGQSGPLISPDIFRKLVKPRWARILAAIKSKTKAQIFFHSCGAVAEFLPDLIEIGVDIINPVQVSATGMNAGDLKRRFGKRLSFWGGGCDTQRVLNLADPEQVRDEVRHRIRDLAPGGGFVFNAVHNIQPGIAPANIVAMFATAKECGRYPIALQQRP